MVQKQFLKHSPKLGAQSKKFSWKFGRIVILRTSKFFPLGAQSWLILLIDYNDECLACFFLLLGVLCMSLQLIYLCIVLLHLVYGTLFWRLLVGHRHVAILLLIFQIFLHPYWWDILLAVLKRHYGCPLASVLLDLVEQNGLLLDLVGHVWE